VTLENSLICIVCNGTKFERIPAPWPHSMTTAGKLVEEPLSKAQCASCGLLQRVGVRHLGHTDFYERHYSFYERPGAAVYDKPRYAAMAKWIRDSLPGTAPRLILDAGCGRGWMMHALQAQYPAAAIEGVEPSEQESENARQGGFRVTTAKVDSRLAFDRKYDLIYTVNVVEHTTDPVDFLRSLGNCLADNGLVAIICPDSFKPSAEFMFSDQNYSFTPQLLGKVAKLAGLHVAAWHPSPEIFSVNDKQLMILSKAKPEPSPKLLGDTSPELFRERCRYVESYAQCDRYLVNAVRGFTEVVNFGTSTWSLLLAAYCPEYWRSVTACAIDGGSGSFQGKQVNDFGKMPASSQRVFVLGVNPSGQAALAKRLEAQGAKCVSWSSFIER
jgi:SAM-dependent methyltransferase